MNFAGIVVAPAVSGLTLGASIRVMFSNCFVPPRVQWLTHLRWAKSLVAQAVSHWKFAGYYFLATGLFCSRQISSYFYDIHSWNPGRIAHRCRYCTWFTRLWISLYKELELMSMLLHLQCLKTLIGASLQSPFTVSESCCNSGHAKPLRVPSGSLFFLLCKIFNTLELLLTLYFHVNDKINS